MRTRLRLGLGVANGVLFAGVFSCVGDSSNPSDGGPDTSTSDVSTDVAIADAHGDATDAAVVCDPTKAFAAPTPLIGFATSANEDGPRLSPDELTLYFSGQGGALNDASTGTDIFKAGRAKRTDAFGAPSPLAVVDTNVSEDDPSITSDGLTLYYEQDTGDVTLWSASRTSIQTDFGNPVALATPLNSPTPSDHDGQPFVTADGAELWFVSDRSGGMGGLDIYVAQANGKSFGTPVLAPTLNSTQHDTDPTLSADRLTIYIGTTRSGGNYDIWVSHRASVSDPFPAPTAVPELNTTSSDRPGWLSPDNCRLYLFTDRAGTRDIYVAERAP